MNYNQFKNLSCYEEFEIQCALTGVSKVDVLKEFGCKVSDYYFFVSNDGVFNWFDLNGNYIEDPGILKKIKEKYISPSISKCIIPSSVTSIGNGTFSYCESLKEITIPDGVTIIDKYAFSHCESLTTINIPDSITFIGTCAFSYCELLEKITIPDSVTSIGYKTFWFCESLKEIVFKGKTLEEVKQMENYPFGIEDESIIKCEL